MIVERFRNFCLIMFFFFLLALSFFNFLFFCFQLSVFLFFCFQLFASSIGGIGVGCCYSTRIRVLLNTAFKKIIFIESLFQLPWRSAFINFPTIGLLVFSFIGSLGSCCSCSFSSQVITTIFFTSNHIIKDIITVVIISVNTKKNIMAHYI